jgi:hypothetical protein
MHGGTLERLVREHLGQSGARLAPDLDRRVVRAIAASVGAGPRTLEGERHLAVFLEPGTTQGFAGFAVTSERLVVGDRSLPLGAVRGARPLDGGAIEVSTWAGALAVRSAAGVALGALCAALGQVREADRALPGCPLLAVSAADPLGVLPEVRGWAQGVDGAALELLNVLMAAVTASAIPLPIAQDLAARAVLLHRTRNEGRGMMEDGGWVSPLSVPDLSAALAEVLGRPARVVQRDDVLTLGWDVDLALSSYKSLSRLRIEGRDGAAVAAARARLFEPLLEREGRLVALRVLFGWHAPAEALMATSADEIERRLRELHGRADLSPLVSGLTHPDEPPPVSKPPETLRRGAMARLDAARRDVDPDAAIQAALELMNLARGYHDAARAFEEIARTYPDRRADATFFQGNAVLSGILSEQGAPRADQMPGLERAVRLFEESMRLGKPSLQVDDSFWQAARAIVGAHPSKLRRRGVLDVYVRTFPRGAHVEEANKLAETLG